MLGELPESLEVNGKELEIRTDYRDILRTFQAFNDPNLKIEEKWEVFIEVVYKNYAEDITVENVNEAIEKALEFIEKDNKDSPKEKRQLIDWEQDEQIIFSAINKVAGTEVRNCEYIHWWTFMGYFKEIGEGMFSTIVNIRRKKSMGKKLEKWEQEYYNKNKHIINIKTKYTDEEQEEINRLLAMLS